MGLPYLNGAQFKEKNGEPMRSNNGYIYIPDMPGTPGEKAPKSFIAALESFPFPEDANNVIQVPYMNRVTKFAGQQIFEDVEVILKVLLDDAATKAIENWRRIVSNAVTGEISYAEDYKVTGLAVQLHPNGVVGKIFQLNGLWPSRYQPGTIDMANDENNKATITFTIDSAHRSEGTNLKALHQIFGDAGDIEVPLPPTSDSGLING